MASAKNDKPLEFAKILEDIIKVLNEPEVFTVPTPENGPVCDFCSDPDVAWNYPTERAIAYAEVINGKPIVGESLPGFAACERCAELIEAGDKDGLAKVSFDTMPDAEDLNLNDERIMDLIIKIHAAFWEKRCGERERMGGRA